MKIELTNGPWTVSEEIGAAADSALTARRLLEALEACVKAARPVDIPAATSPPRRPIPLKTRGG